MPLVSIIVPVYNVQNVVQYCIESILKQTVKDFELLLINDGSTDGSGMVCDKYSQKDSRVIVIHKENGGVSSARNIGFAKAQGKYIVCVDSDDFVEPDYLQTLLEVREKFPNAGHIWCCFQTVTTSNKEDLKLNLASDNEEISLFDRKDIMTLYELWLLQMPWNKLYDAELIKKDKLCMDESLNLGEDLVFNLQYLNAVLNTDIVIVNKPVYNYVINHNNSLDNKYCSNLLQSCEKTNNIIKNYMVKWKIDSSQEYKYYNMCFNKYERILDNTFKKGNLQSKKEKVQFNNSVIKSEKFKQALENRTRFVHPLLIKAYKTGNYKNVLKLKKLIKLKNKFVR